MTCSRVCDFFNPPSDTLARGLSDTQSMTPVPTLHSTGEARNGPGVSTVSIRLSAGETQTKSLIAQTSHRSIVETGEVCERRGVEQNEE